MKFRYRNTDTAGKWLSHEAEDFNPPADAHHVSPFGFKETDEGRTMLYAESFYFDSDNKTDILKIRDGIRAAGVELETVELSASGGKGYHIRIPRAIFRGKRNGFNLDKHHKHFAKLLADLWGVEADVAIYSKDHLLRTHNKKRACNGRFKVQIQWGELDGIDYEAITSSPRELFQLAPPTLNETLYDVWISAGVELEAELKQAQQPKPKPTYSGDAPRCQDWLFSGNAAGINQTQQIVQTASRMHANFGGFDVDDFAENNATAKTPAREVAARLNSMIKSEHGKEWSCGYVRDLQGFSCATCKGCPQSEGYRIEQLIKKVTTNQKHIAALVKELKTATGSERNQLGKTLCKCLALTAEKGRKAGQAIKFAVDAGATEADAREIIEGAVQEREARARKAHNITNFEGLTRVNVDDLDLKETANLIVQKMDLDRFFRGKLGETERVVTSTMHHDYGGGISGDFEISEIKLAQPKPVTFLLPFAMGQGKTVTAQELNQEIKKILYDKFLRFRNTLPKKEANKLKFADYAMNVTMVTPRVSLTKGLANQFDVADYQGIEDKRNHRGSFATCADSLHQFQTRNPLLITDEARQTLEHITTAETVGTAGKTGRKAIFENYIKTYQSAIFTLVLDADLNDETVSFYKAHGGGREIILLEKTAPKMQAKHVVLTGGHNEARDKLLELLLSGQNGTVAATSEKQALMTYKFLKDNGISTDDILVLTGENKGGAKQKAFYASPSQESKKYKIIIHSPVLGSGVSIENEALTFTILLNTSVVPSNEAWQMVARNRKAREIYVSFDRASNYERVTDPLIFIEAEKERIAENYIADLDNNGMTTKTVAELVTEIQVSELTQRQARITATRNADMNDYANNFIALGKVQGREFEYSGNESKDFKLPELEKETIEERDLRRFYAKPIDAKNAEIYATSSGLTQEQSDELKRDLATKMAGKDEIELKDVAALDKTYPRVLKVERILKPESELHTQDTENIKTQNKSGSSVKEQRIFNEVLSVITDESLENLITEANQHHEEFKHGVMPPFSVSNISSEQAFKICRILKKHHKALSHVADYSKLPKSYAVARVISYLKKYGFDCPDSYQKSKGKRERIYPIIFSPYLAHCVSNRAGLKGNLSCTEV